MSDLIVVGFSDTEKADRALTKMVSLSKEHLVELEDAVIVVRNEQGKIHIKQSVNLTALGATSGLVTGGLWGALVGLLFLNPLAGFAIGGALGAGTGALSGSLSDYGIDDDFIKSLSETIPNNSSPVCAAAQVPAGKSLARAGSIGLQGQGFTDVPVTRARTETAGCVVQKHRSGTCRDYDLTLRTCATE